MSEVTEQQSQASTASLLGDARRLLSHVDGTTLAKLGERAGLSQPALEAVLRAEPDTTEEQLPPGLIAAAAALWQQAVQLAAEHQGTPSAALPADARQEIIALKKQLQATEQQLKARIVAEQTLQKQLGKTRIEIATLKSAQLNTRMLQDNAAKEKAQSEQYHKQFEAAKAEIYQLNKSLDGVRKKYQETLAEQQREIAQLKQSLAELAGKQGSSDEQQQALLAQRDAEITRLQQLLASRNDELQLSQQQHEQALAAVETQLAAQRHHAESADQRAKQLEQQLLAVEQQAQARLAALEEQLVLQASKADADEGATAELQRLQGEVTDMQGRLVERDIEISDLSGALETAQQAMAELEAQLQASRSELTQKQQQAAAKMVEMQNQLKEFNSRLRDYHQLKAEQEESQQQLQQAERKLADALGQREQAARLSGRLLTDLEVLLLQIGDVSNRDKLQKLIDQYQQPVTAKAPPAGG